MRFFAFVSLLLLSSLPALSNGVHIIVSVDWEGEDLENKNLQAMKKFREDYPDIKLLHFLNAAYFTKPDAKASTVRKKINSVLLDGDEHGLHIHAWKSLFEAAALEYKSCPSWDGDKCETRCSYDCGHSVPISTYSYDELRRVVNYSSKMLVKNGFNQPKSFRAGGWMAAPHVLHALADEGFVLDSSALPADYLDRSYAKFIKTWVNELWEGITITSQPEQIRFGSSSIIEVPDNGCLADYVSGEEIFETFLENVRLFKKDQTKDIYYSIGFHQETAADYLGEFRKGIDLIRSYQAKNAIPIEFARYPLFR